MEARRPAAAGVEPEESLCHDFLIRRELATVSKNGNYKRKNSPNTTYPCLCISLSGSTILIILKNEQSETAVYSENRETVPT